jgi:antitoxin component of MazEF toxin-antitoxin module
VTIKKSEPELTLEALVARITPENRHGETGWGRPVGREVLEEW